MDIVDSCSINHKSHYDSMEKINSLKLFTRGCVAAIDLASDVQLLPKRTHTHTDTCTRSNHNVLAFLLLCQRPDERQKTTNEKLINIHLIEIYKKNCLHPLTLFLSFSL